MSLAYDYRENDEEGGALAPVLRKDLLTGNYEQINYDGNALRTVNVANRVTGTGGYFSYDNQGNIIGTYDSRWSIVYGTNGATPHQISQVTYNSNFAPHGERKVSFNSTLWKAKKVTDAGLTYTYSYGTDRQRFKTVLSRGDKVLRTRYYTDDYDLTLDSLGKKREVHYIYGGNGLAAIYVKNAGKDSLFAAATDRQGSLMATMHTASGKVERYSYDLFGRRRSADNWLQNLRAEPRFSRGYCMHEHVPEMDMIDMNGRLYDPVLCQFLSPDPYIQDPTNWQNYNRYAYCLQNPMLYTDPTGEKVAWWQAIATTVLNPSPGTINGLMNVYCNNESGYIQSTSDMWKCFGQGFVAGTVAPSIKGCSVLPTGEFFSGNTAENAFKIWAGGSYIDGDTDFWEGCWYGISANTVEYAHTTLGSDLSQIKNAIGCTDRVDYLDGMTFCTNEHADVSGANGVTMGNYSNINISGEIDKDFKDFVLTAYRGIYMHEYGHLHQSRKYGPLFLSHVGLPSLCSAIKSLLRGDDSHKWQWYEIEASSYAKKHFTQKYGDSVWTPEIEEAHPTSKKNK